MKNKKITFIAFAFLFSLLNLKAQKTLEDWNSYVDSKNKSGTGFLNLVQGTEEKAAQTYHYSGPGRVSSVRVEGDNPGLLFSVPLRVSIFSVDSKGRPVSEISGADVSFQTWSSSVQVDYSGGVNVSGNFAVVVALRSTAYFGQTFQVKYTGNGEGNGRDLASIAGSSTGNNWGSLLASPFSKDGDLYLIPKMAHDVTASFSATTQCASTTTSVAFTNNSKFTKDSMFNKLAWSGYAGSNKLYLWKFGDGTTSNMGNPTKVYASAGSYTVKLITTIIGWNGSVADSTTMRISVGLAAGTAGSTNLTCYNSNNGTLTASATGGTTPYKYSLDGEDYQTSTSFTGLAAGTYTLHVMDALGCKATTTFAITQPKSVSFSSVGTTTASCNATDGAILAVGTGGTGALQYKLNSGSFQSTGSFTGLGFGSYTVTVSDANSCTNSMVVVVDNTSSPKLSISFNSVSCNGGTDGSITLTSTGGTGASTYSINGGASYQSSGSFTGLAAGKYSVLVKDAAGCGEGDVVTIKEPSKIDFFVNSKAATCFGKANGEIHITSAIGGIGKLSYSINGTNYQSTGDFLGLVAGNYTAYVKDVAACVITQSITVTEPTKMNSSKVVTDAVCNGSNNGSILITTTGGTPAYSYSLDGSVYQATGLFNGVGAGNYTIAIKDMNNCPDTIKATVGQPTLITASISSTNSTCGNSNGSMLVTAIGGSGSSYTYSMDGTTFITPGQFTSKQAGTYVVAVKDGAGCIVVVSGDIMDSNGPVLGTISSTNVTCNGGNDGTISVNSVTGGTGLIQYSLDGANWQTSNKFTNLKAGSYTVIVKDANGCISNSTPKTITQPSAIVILKSVSNVTCYGANNGSVTITASGGAGTMAYSIDGGFSWQSDKTFNSLYAGDYTALVRDAGGCANAIAFTIATPTPIVPVIGVLNVSCNGAGNGELTINASGGKTPYTYSIGSGYTSNNTFKNLNGGSLTYYVKDANNCIVSKSVTIFEPNELGINSLASNVSCAGGNNGVVDLTISGGVWPYTYKWSNNATTEDIFNLVAGTYSVVVTDANGCKDNATFTLTQPSSPIVINGVVANGTGSNGSIDITVTGGTQPYSFSWTNNKITEDLSGLAPGNYTVTVTDANGCVATSQFTVANAAGVSEEAINNGLRMYPNPTSDLVTIELNGYKLQNVNILNSVGKVVYSNTPDANIVNINTSTLTPGLYYVQIVAEGNKVTQKLLINR